MGEILFRGKRCDNGEWVYGDLLNLGVDYEYAIRTHSDREHGQVIAVNKNTVGQFTGLTANGKKIFEGDIVKREYTLWHGETKKTRETQIGVVVYSNKDCGFCLEKVCNLRKPWDGDTIEVIGNIHDNPELLEVHNG